MEPTSLAVGYRHGIRWGHGVYSSWPLRAGMDHVSLSFLGYSPHIGCICIVDLHVNVWLHSDA